MASFSFVKLQDISTKIGSGATPKGGEESYKKDGITLIRSLNVYDFKFETKGLAFIDELQAKQLKNVIVEENDVLLNITGASVARCCLVPKKLLPARVNQHVSIIRINPKLASSRYVLYCLNSYQYKNHLLTLVQKGATREALTKETISNFEIPFPPLPTQEKIAGILSAYDDLIENNTRRIEILEEMARMLYREWFVKFCFPGHEAVQFVESELGLIPEGWEVKQIQDLPIKIIDGDRSKNYPKASEFTNEGILFLSTKNINQFKIDLSDSNFISKEKFLNIKKGRVIPLDIIMTTRGSIGKVALFNCTLKDALINAQMLIIRADNLEINQLYLFYLMSDQEFQQSLKNFASGSAQPQIPIQDLKQIFILCPSSKIQKEFSKIVSNNVEMIKNLQQKNINLRKTRDLLLPRLISGEIDVENLAINTGIQQ